VVVNAAWALYVLGKEKEAKKVFRRLLQHDDHLVREEVLEKIGSLPVEKDADLVDILTKALKDANIFVVETAKRIFRGVWKQRLRHPKPEVREQAVRALGRLGALEELSEALNDQDKWVAFVAARALAQAGNLGTTRRPKRAVG